MGHRQPIKKLEMWAPNVVTNLPKVKHTFRIGCSKDYGACCVWISACMLVDVDDPRKSAVMMDKMKESKE